MTRQLGRRQWSQLMGIGGLGTPLLMRSAFAQAQAEAGDIPKRLFVFNFPNGVLRDEFGFQADGRTLHAPFAPLQRFADRALFYDGLNVASWTGGAGVTQHVHAPALLLCGEQHLPGQAIAGGTSLDVTIGRHLRTPLQAVDHYAFGSPYTTPVSWSGRNVPVTPQIHLGQAYADLFSHITDGQQDQSALEARRVVNERRRSVLDFSVQRYNRAKARMSRPNQLRLEQHADVLADLQSQIQDPTFNQCQRPPNNDFASPWGEDEKLMVQSLQMAKAALACGSTRSISYNETGNMVPGDMNDPRYDNHLQLSGLEHPSFSSHAISHMYEGQSSSVQQAMRRDNVRILQWRSHIVADLADFLASLPEPDGSTALDHSLILWVTECSELGEHSTQDMRFLTVGNVDGFLKTGKNVKLGGQPHANLLLTILHAFGKKDASFGPFSTGTLGSDVHI